MADEKDKEQRIREKAFDLWEMEGRPEGLDKEHWELAKAEIRAEDTPAEAGNPPIPGPYQQNG
jgi:hypothetical protein